MKEGRFGKQDVNDRLRGKKELVGLEKDGDKQDCKSNPWIAQEKD